MRWTVKSAPGSSVLIQFDQSFDVQHHIECSYDTVTIIPVVRGQEQSPFTFCGPNKQGYLSMPSNGVNSKFSNTAKNGQKAWDFPWDTYSDEIIVEFNSDNELEGGFAINFTESPRQFQCKTRNDCKHIGLTQHICAFDKVSLDKVCKEVACTVHNHCTNDIDLKTYEICKKNECQAVDCTHRKHCDVQQVCNKDKKCEDVQCSLHVHCAGFNDGRSKCNGKTNMCENVACANSKHCASGSICQNNKCKKQECIGNKMCSSVPGCKGGKCLCASRKCVPQECVKNTHCADASICLGNKCVSELDGKKVCRGNKDCDGKQKCVAKLCEKVECRIAKHCDALALVTGKSYLCSNENSVTPNKCYEVQCSAHNDCDAKHVCMENQCVPTACRENSECDANQLCHKPNKKDPTKNKCKAVDCTSNAGCKNHSKKACQDGQCLCESNQCVVKECVKSTHCGVKENCHDNICTKVDCKSHDDCVGFFDDLSPAKCFPNCEEKTSTNPANGKLYTKTYCSPECRKVECRVETDCDITVPETCNTDTNQCAAVQCRGHEFCTEKRFPDVCRDGKCNCSENICQAVTCRDNTHCDGAKREVCTDNQCVAAECTAHDHCGDYGRCQNKKCVTVNCKDNAQCGLTGNLLQKCDKPTGECVQIECLGHKSCNAISNTGAGEDCTDGTCLCKLNFCEKQECRLNDHCPGSKQRCQNNHCETVECTAHDHCTGNDGAQQCSDNVCVNVACRKSEHCGDKQICGGEDLNNACITVDCLGHSDCEENFGDKFMCSEHTCIEKTCRNNEHCNGGDPNGKNICEANECVQVECSHHDHCSESKGTNYKCVKHECEKVQCRVADAHCLEDELCDKDTNECYQVDCRGHNMCQEKSLTDPFLFGHCADGHCLCEETRCVAQECRTNAHCAINGDRSRCQANKCESVQCSAHDHCKEHDERQDCKDGKCTCNKNICELVTCRVNEHCDDTEVCSGEKPEDGVEPNTCVEVGCRSHDACQLGGVAAHCINHECESVECTDESHCDSDKALCLDAQCEEQQCRQHEHCNGFFGAGVPAKCVDRECQKVECTTAFDCAENELCDKKSNECFVPECKGHSSCLTHKGCEDGHCTCEENECKTNMCRLNSHCPEQHQCKDLKCEKVECDNHDQCKDNDNNGTKGMCKLNKCKQVDCKTMPDCHVKHGATNYVCESNTCKKVDCTRNTDCIGPAICKSQKCEQIECISASDCPAGEYCSYNQCAVFGQ